MIDRFRLTNDSNNKENIIKPSTTGIICQSKFNSYSATFSAHKLITQTQTKEKHI